MDNLTFYRSFLAVAEAGSLTAGARRIGLSQPAISQQIAAMERALDVTLLHRLHEGARLTPEGQIVAEHARRLIACRNDLTAELERHRGRISGRLRFTTYAGLSEMLMPGVIAHLAEHYPELHLVLRVEDRITDLTREGYDLALRSGDEGGPNERRYKVGTTEILHVATPAFLERHGSPNHPEDLSALPFIQYRDDIDGSLAELTRNDERRSVRLQARMTAQAPGVVLNALMAGQGFTKAPAFMLASHIASGQLEVLLPEWKLPIKTLYFVTPSGVTPAPALDVLRRTILSRLATLEGVSLSPAARAAIPPAHLSQQSA